MDRERTARHLHLWIGWASLVAFLLTGQYMSHFHEPPVAELEPGLRMLFRSRHIYLLFTALLNLLAASRAGHGRPRWLALLGSSLLMLSPALLLAAFILEATVLAAPTGLSIYGVQAALGGSLGCLLAHRLGADRRRD